MFYYNAWSKDLKTLKTPVYTISITQCSFTIAYIILSNIPNVGLTIKLRRLTTILFLHSMDLHRITRQQHYFQPGEQIPLNRGPKCDPLPTKFIIYRNFREILNSQKKNKNS